MLMKAILNSALTVLSEIGINDIIDILIVAYILYKAFIFIRESRAQMLLKGVLIIVLTYVVATIFKLQMVSYIVDVIIRNSAIALIVVFQPEIRSLLERVGRSKLAIRGLFTYDEDEQRRRETLSTINAVVDSARALQKLGMGALIVFERKVLLDDIIAPATPVDGVPNVGLITNIFWNKAPLHDGAMIIRDNRVCAAGCFLPITHQTDIDPNLGSRHRAAIGMSENSDAVVVVVSEETGRLSVALEGRIKSSFDADDLSAELIKLFLHSDDEQPQEKKSLGERAREWFDANIDSKKETGGLTHRDGK